MILRQLVIRQLIRPISTKLSLEAENNFLDLPLNTLMDIKNAWHEHHMTCLNVSSADMLQFAIFFATIRQKHIPEPLITGTSTANAKRETLKNEFLWGRQDEKKCDIAWTDNLPSFITPASGGPIPARCTAAGGEINRKMMDRNGFTEGMLRKHFLNLQDFDWQMLNVVVFPSPYFSHSPEEATVLIGAHSIGLIRHTFGASHAGPVR